jgi:phosphopantetheine--protein transferase-like protein
MLGKLVMETKVLEFLSRLLGYDVAAGTQVAISSMQRAQLVTWLNANGIDADFNRFKSNLISVNDILAGQSVEATGATPSTPATAPVMTQVSASLVTLPRFSGLGLDLQDITKLPQVTDFRSDPFYSRNFTDREIAYCIQRPEPIASFGGLWAAKEAIVKSGAFTPAKSGIYGDIEISHSPEGAPTYPGCMLSISHEGNLAVAVCVRLG